MLFIQSLGTGLNIMKNIFLGGYSGALVQTFGFARNVLGAKGLFGRKSALTVALLQLTVGLYLNQEGVWGLIPIVASISYTWGVFHFTKAQHLRWLLVFNFLLWFVYQVELRDYLSAITGMGVVFFNLVAIWKNRNNKVAEA